MNIIHTFVERIMNNERFIFSLFSNQSPSLYGLWLLKVECYLKPENPFLDVLRKLSLSNQILTSRI